MFTKVTLASGCRVGRKEGLEWSWVRLRLLFAEPQVSEMALARVECRCRRVFWRVKLPQKWSMEARDVD